MVPTSVPCEVSVTEQIVPGIDNALDDIIGALTRPLTPEEKSPKSVEIEKPPRIIFKGDIGEVNRFIYNSGLGDGLPIIPPTEEAVAEMLTGTDLPPDHVVGKLEPLMGKATVEKIAVNAVMAGALPTYMPLLIAAIKICAHPTSGFGGWAGSTGSWAPFWIINGPVRNDLRINSGTGALSPGNIANATIGRAIQLIINNVAGVRKGIEDMGTLGNPGKYSMVQAENEEESPWEPLHVEHGFQKEDSVISVFTPNSFVQFWPYGSDDDGILRALLDKITITGRGAIVSFVPPHAKTMAELGWTKQDIKKFVSEYARVSPYRLGSYWGTSGPAVNPETKPGLYRTRIPYKDWDTVSVIGDPSLITIIIAGGPGAFIGVHTPGAFYPSMKTIQKIELPANWAELVEKYKDIKPVYAMY